MKVYSSPNLTMVGHLKNVLQSHEIACDIRNEFLGAIVGQIPPIQCWPELWIADPSQAQRAGQIIAETLEPIDDDARVPWHCRTCNEEIESQFTLCWNCGTERSDNGDAGPDESR